MDKMPVDVAVEYPHGVMFVIPEPNVEFETRDTDEWPTIGQAIDDALDNSNLELVKEWSKHL